MLSVVKELYNPASKSDNGIFANAQQNLQRPSDYSKPRCVGVMGHHFVLIHGGCHGAWAWAKTVDRLQKAGCKATALDLASAGNDSTDPNTITSMAEYNKPAVDFVASLPDDEEVVLIAHSMGGFTNLELMESFPQKIALAMFVSASVTPSGVALMDSPLGDLMFKDTLLGESCIFAFANGADKPPTSMMIADNCRPELFYSGCAPEDIELASTLVKWFPVEYGNSCYIYQRKTWASAFCVCEKLTR